MVLLARGISIRCLHRMRKMITESQSESEHERCGAAILGTEDRLE